MVCMELDRATNEFFLRFVVDADLFDPITSTIEMDDLSKSSKQRTTSSRLSQSQTFTSALSRSRLHHEAAIRPNAPAIFEVFPPSFG